MATRKKKGRKKGARKGARKGASGTDELTRLHMTHLRKRFAAMKKQLRSTKLTPAQHEKVLAEAKRVRAKLERHKGR